MDEKHSFRNNSELRSADSRAAKYDLRRHSGQIKEYFEDHIELKDLKFNPSELDDPENELSQLTDMVSQMDIQRQRNMRFMEVGMRAGAVIVLFVFVCFFRARNVPNVYTEDFCMRDKGHILTAGMNEAVNKSPELLTFMQLTSSGLMDIVFLNMIIWWMLKGKTGLMLQSLATFYVLRGVV